MTAVAPTPMPTGVHPEGTLPIKRLVDESDDGVTGVGTRGLRARKGHVS